MQQAIIFAVLVGFINVALNVTVRAAARPSTALMNLLGSEYTWIMLLIIAFLIGSTSLIAMFFFYRLEGNLARGLILMGTVSIVVGSVVAMILSGSVVDRIEIILLGTLSVLFLFRWMKTVPWFDHLISGRM